MGEDGYNPTYKYYIIWYVIIHNVNYVSKRGGLDKCVYKYFWGQQVWCDTNSGLAFNILNKFTYIKGFNMVLVTYVCHFFLISYVRWQNMHNHPTNFSTQVPSKFPIIIDELDSMVVGFNTTVVKNNLHYNKPDICWYSY